MASKEVFPGLVLDLPDSVDTEEFRGAFKKKLMKELTVKEKKNGKKKTKRTA